MPMKRMAIVMPSCPNCTLCVLRCYSDFHPPTHTQQPHPPWQTFWNYPWPWPWSRRINQNNGCSCKLKRRTKIAKRRCKSKVVVMECRENTIKLCKKTDITRRPQPLMDTILSSWALGLIVVFVFKKRCTPELGHHEPLRHQPDLGCWLIKGFIYF